MGALPLLIGEDLYPARDYLRDITLAMGAFQRTFLPKHRRLWEHGLEVSMRGLTTQAVEINGEEVRISLDLVRNNIRIGNTAWKLKEYSSLEIYNNLRVWLQSRNVRAEMEAPEFTGGRFDKLQTAAYAETLWWMHKQFESIKDGLKEGVASPVLLYPHHFDLAMSWFPWDDERQLSLGFSTGDESIPEPYVYFTTYPELSLDNFGLPDGVKMQKKGFKGAYLLYAYLQTCAEASELLSRTSELIINNSKNRLA